MKKFSFLKLIYPTSLPNCARTLLYDYGLIILSIAKHLDGTLSYIKYIPRITFILILPSLNQRWMHHLSYTNSRFWTNTPTPFGARLHHLQGLTTHKLTFQHVDWSQNTCPTTCCRNAVIHSRYTNSESSCWSPRRLVVKITLALNITNALFWSINRAPQFILSQFLCCGIARHAG